MPHTDASRRLTGLLLPLLLAAATASACKVDNPAFDPNLPAPGQSCVRGVETRQVFPLSADPRAIDILLVVSDSPGSEPLQRRLAAAMPSFVSDLRARGVDFQIGVISGDTSNATTAGQLTTGGVGVAGCNASQRVILPSMGENASLFATCNVQLGAGGPHVQEPVEAASLALTSRATEPANIGGNAGFLRSHAALLVLFAADRDDCSNTTLDLGGAPDAPTACAWSRASLKPIPDAANLLLSLKEDPARVAVGVIAGPDLGAPVNTPELLTPACRDAGSAPVYPADRLLQLAGLLSPRAGFESACAASLSGSLRRLTEQLVPPQPITLCPQARLAAPPLAVKRQSDGEDEELAQGADGYLYLGATDACPNGAVAVNPLLLGANVQSVAVDFCAL